MRSRTLRRAALLVVALLWCLPASALAQSNNTSDPDLYKPAPAPNKTATQKKNVEKVAPGASDLSSSQIQNGTVVDSPSADQVAAQQAATAAANRAEAQRKARARRRAAAQRRERRAAAAKRERNQKLRSAVRQGVTVAKTKLIAAASPGAARPVASDRGTGGGNGSLLIALVLAIGLPVFGIGALRLTRSRRHATS